MFVGQREQLRGIVVAVIDREITGQRELRASIGVVVTEANDRRPLRDGLQTVGVVVTVGHGGLPRDLELGAPARGVEGVGHDTLPGGLRPHSVEAVVFAGDRSRDAVGRDMQPVAAEPQVQHADMTGPLAFLEAAGEVVGPSAVAVGNDGHVQTRVRGADKLRMLRRSRCRWTRRVHGHHVRSGRDRRFAFRCRR